MRSKILVAFAFALVALAGVAVAAIPDGNGIIHACRKVDGGALRAVAKASACRSSERPLAWNRQGPAGLTGPAPVREASTTGMRAARSVSAGSHSTGTCPAPNPATTRPST